MLLMVLFKQDAKMVELKLKYSYIKLMPVIFIL